MSAPPESVERSARFSRCRRYRWRLTRSFGAGPTVTFVGLNPSTADASVDDPTIRRCMGFARGWGFARLHMVNLFAFRATAPADLFAAEDPVGTRNLTEVRRAIREADAVIACWGFHGAFRDQDLIVGRVLPGHTTCLGMTQAGHPRHPLYLRKDTTRKPFSLRHASSEGVG